MHQKREETDFQLQLAILFGGCTVDGCRLPDIRLVLHAHALCTQDDKRHTACGLWYLYLVAGKCLVVQPGQGSPAQSRIAKPSYRMSRGAAVNLVYSTLL